ncbi:MULTISPECIES: (2Fe-2S)-binding protein [Pseudomonas]|jgi:predicted molibdopterin-dependent oxidoreductase YjgC|uniref:(2Fe-2S)-binding protein n=1 Tax=Pseudomonas TaxID=286 RepID=UPI00048FB479|nr:MULTISPECIES: (2Fe-2S)-binding protein [Pseudomonas]MCW2268151.1 putative molibdopterin-dependent oxidoreductase YjgC [Pseudomonas sp. JUb96]PRA67881.1 sarcosine oxidase subunit alpha [Pseudomonas sp. MYb187]
MPTEPLFRPLSVDIATVQICFDDQPLQVPAGVSLAAALLASGVRQSRSTPISGSARAPFCMMGVCFECLVQIDGAPNCQACLTPVRPGMQVYSQRGARRADPQGDEHGR